MNSSPVESVIESRIGKLFTGAQLAISQNGVLVYSRSFASLREPLHECLVTKDSLYDLASVTKLFTVTAMMTLIEEGTLCTSLDQSVTELYPEFCGTRSIQPYPHPLQPGVLVEVVPSTMEMVDVSKVTIRHLLTHTSGLPAWLPLWKLSSNEERLNSILTTPFAYPTGCGKVIYSDIGLILLGLVIEKVTGKSLDLVIRERVLDPLGLDAVRFGPIPEPFAFTADTEFYEHQGRRMSGEVHDENAWSFGRPVGHAGLFGSAESLVRFGASFLKAELLSPKTIEEMTRLQAVDGDARRGLGFVLYPSPNKNDTAEPSYKIYGHTGFTGTAIWIDPERDLVIAFFTNRVYYGRENGKEIIDLRSAVLRGICDIFDKT